MSGGGVPGGRLGVIVNGVMVFEVNKVLCSLGVVTGAIGVIGMMLVIDIGVVANIGVL